MVPFVGGRINTLWPLAYNQLCPKLSVQLPIEPVVVPFSVTVFHWARRINLLSESVELNVTVKEDGRESQTTLPSGLRLQCASGVRAEATCRTAAVAVTDATVNARIVQAMTRET